MWPYGHNYINNNSNIKIKNNNNNSHTINNYSDNQEAKDNEKLSPVSPVWFQNIIELQITQLEISIDNSYSVTSIRNSDYKTYFIM